MERYIHIAVEFIIDLSSYLLSESSFRVPDTYKEVILETSRLCDIEEGLVSRVRGLLV